jgi:hypothetical protein
VDVVFRFEIEFTRPEIDGGAGQRHGEHLPARDELRPSGEIMRTANNRSCATPERVRV